MGAVIRVGQPEDAAALAELAARIFQDTFAADNDPADMALFLAETYGVRQQGGELVDPAITTFLAEVDGVLAGYAQLRRSDVPTCVTGDTPIELWRLYVSQAWHGRGVARDLMAAVEQTARRLGARTLWLGVWEHNARAQAFYHKYGFTDVGAHDFLLGTDRQVDRIYQRSLSPEDRDDEPGR